jgi:hypothetical protein
MKLQVLAALLGSTAALDTITGLNFDATINCAQCIRNGYVYCTTSPYFLGAAKPASDMCCNPNVGLDSTNCATGYSGSAGANTPVGGSAVCNYSYSSRDKQLLSCPQLTGTCGTQNVYTFANKAAVPSVVQTTGFTQQSSCTYVIKATCDSPGFEIKEMTSPD